MPVKVLYQYLFQQRQYKKHGAASIWPWELKWLEHSAWIRRLGVRVPLSSRQFLSQKLWHFHKNISSCVENECCCPHRVNFAWKAILYPLHYPFHCNVLLACNIDRYGVFLFGNIGWLREFLGDSWISLDASGLVLFRLPSALSFLSSSVSMISSTHIDRSAMMLSRLKLPSFS